MIIDAHQHLKNPRGGNGELLEPVSDFNTMLLEHEKLLKSSGVVKANVIFNSESFLFSHEVERIIKAYYIKGKRTLLFTFMVDPVNENSASRIKALSNIPVLGIKFHSFFQQIDETKFDRVINLAKIASENGLFVIIDGSRSQANFYKYDNLKLLINICRAISTPIIFAHSGSLNVKEALLIGLENPHLYFDTSFSLSFWEGSSIERDFSFAINKLGPDRFLFGSDYPVNDFKKEIALQKALFNKFGLSKQGINMIFGHSAEKLFGQKKIDYKNE